MNREIEARLKISAVDRTERAFRSVSNRLHQAERQISAYNRAERQVAAFRRTEAAASGALLSNARLLGGAAVAAGVTQTVRAFSSYEDALVEIQKKGGFTAAQIAQVGQEARDLSTSGELAVPLEEILAAYERGAAAGIPIEELREFAVLSTRASDAFEMAAEDTSNAIAGWKTNLQMTNPEIERMLDLVNGLADSGISDESDILSFMSRSGPALQNIGFANEQIAALGATMLNLQIEWETASRGINSATSSILAPQSKGAQARLMNMFAPRGGFQAFRQRFLQDGAAGLQEFMDVVSEMDDLEQLDTLIDIVGKEFGPQFQRLIAGSAELRRNLLYADNQEGWFGSLADSYQLKLGTLSSQWQVFKNQVGALAIDMGSMGLPALESGLAGAKSIVQDIDAGLKAFSAKIDVGAFNDAREAIFGVRNNLGELTGMEVPEDSEIVKFFRDLAVIANTVNETIDAIENGINFISDPFGLRAEAEASANPPTTYAPLFGDEEKFSISLGGGVLGIGDVLDDALGRAGDLLGWFEDRHDAARTEENPSYLSESARLNAEIASRRNDGDGRIEAAFGVTEVSGKSGRLSVPERVAGNLDGYALPSGTTPSPQFRDAAANAPMAAAPDNLDASVDALRLAMEQGGITITDAGTDAGSSITLAGQEASASLVAAITAMATAIESAIRAGGSDLASSIASALAKGVRVNGGATASVNANLGRSMPDVGTPGL